MKPGGLYKKGYGKRDSKFCQSAGGPGRKNAGPQDEKIPTRSFLMPGGGQGEGELMPEAVCREVGEETGLEITCSELLFVIEALIERRFTAWI
jgi:8-oxo-dGTP pyrophosphatase MutT (NUDIX family)